MNKKNLIIAAGSAVLGAAVSVLLQHSSISKKHLSYNSSLNDVSDDADNIAQNTVEKYGEEAEPHWPSEFQQECEPNETQCEDNSSTTAPERARNRKRLDYTLCMSKHPSDVVLSELNGRCSIREMAWIFDVTEGEIRNWLTNLNVNANVAIHSGRPSTRPSDETLLWLAKARYTNDDIGKLFGVMPKTVCRWLTAIRKRNSC